MVRLLVILAMLVQPFAALGRIASSCDMHPPIALAPISHASDCCADDEAPEACRCCTPNIAPAPSPGALALHDSHLAAATADCTICDAACRLLCEAPRPPITSDARKNGTIGGKNSGATSSIPISTLNWPLRLALAARTPAVAFHPSPGVHQRLALLCLWTT
jgi:hypothetical protein